MKSAIVGFCLLGLGFPLYAADVPDWVLNPDFPGGIAAAECIVYSGSLSIDRLQVVAAARHAMAQQLEVRVQAVDKLYTERISVGKEPPKVRTTFESVSTQLTDRALNNTKVVKIEVFKTPNQPDQLCALVAMTPHATQEHFKEMIKVVDKDAPPELEKELFETFRVRSADLAPAKR